MAKRRSQGDPLPKYKVEVWDEYEGWFIVKCPYEDCGGTFYVMRRHWLRPKRYTTYKGETHSIKGRRCPYCMRVSIPQRKG